MPSFIDKSGAQQNVELDVNILRAANDKNLTVRQYINAKYPTCSETETFKQMCTSEGLYFSKDESQGIRSTPISAILNPPAMDASNVASPAPASRILFPSALLAVMEDKMSRDRVSPVQLLDSMVAVSTTVANARTEQPVISYAGAGGPESVRAQQIGQLALPPNMMTITASDITRSIPTFSVGLSISDEAMQATSLDLVSLALMRQKEVEMFKMAGVNVLGMLQGDTDTKQTALAVTKAVTFDAGVVAAGAISHLAYISWLYSASLYRQIDYIIVDSIATALAIENRAGKPVIVGDNPNSPRIDTTPSVIYPALAQKVKVFVAPSEWSLPANTLMGFDSGYAIAKLINANAEYQATERWALRKGEALRFDFGQTMYRLYDEAFSVLSLTLA